MRGRIFILLLLSLSSLMSETISAAERIYNVLFIQSYTNHTPWHNRLTAGLMEGLENGGVKANIVVEYLNADYWTFASECVIMQRICERARQKNTDLIVTSGDEAFFTLTHCGDSLAYQIPVVVSGIKYPDWSVLKKMPNVCGYTVKNDFETILNGAKRIFPSRTEIVCLADSSFLSTVGVKQLQEYWPTFQKKYPECSWKMLNVQTRTPTTVIASICYEYNAYNRIVIAPKWTPFLSFIGKNSKAPVFACQGLALTNGVFGAYDTEAFKGTLMAGKRAAQVLKGMSPTTYGVENLTGQILFDYKQLQYFRIDSGKVDKLGTILNIPLVERYRIELILLYSFIVVALVLLVIGLYRINRRESRKRIEAQTRLLIQQRLVEQRDELDNIFCSIRDGLITYDTDLRIHFINRPLIQMLGLPPQFYKERNYEGQFAGSIFYILANGENILQDILGQVRTTQQAASIPENAFMQEIRSGVYFPVSGEAVPIYANDRMTGIAIVCRNISEEEMQKRFFNMAIEESAIYPWQYNRNTNCFTFPGGLLKRFDFTDDAENPNREQVSKFIHPDDLDHARQLFDAMLVGQEMDIRMNFRLRRKDGHYEWWEFRSTAYDGLIPEAPYRYMGVCQSIQRYKDTEEALILARDRALQADKLKSAFLANMSHEIRTPLNSIVGFSDLLKDINAFSSEEVKQFVETINTNCTLLLALMNDILDLSRIESGTMDFQFASYNLTFIMQQVYDSQRLSMPSGVLLRTDFPEDSERYINTDPVRLKQVVNNLINNAKKFTVEGSITLGYYVNEDDETVVFVEDTGFGISEESQKHIFERFFKVDNFTQGAGLGLSICRTIVERLQGEISVKSQVGKGTRFEVKLPVLSLSS